MKEDKTDLYIGLFLISAGVAAAIVGMAAGLLKMAALWKYLFS
jgi:hypothetical protein